MGAGRGARRPGFPAPFDPWAVAEVTPAQELHLLKAEAQQIKDELTSIERRIMELEGEGK